MCSSCQPYVLYYCTVAATSAATKMPYTTVYLHIHAMCSRKLNTFNNQIIDLSKSPSCYTHIMYHHLVVLMSIVSMSIEAFCTVYIPSNGVTLVQSDTIDQLINGHVHAMTKHSQKLTVKAK